MGTKKNESNLVWIDMEMSGLNPDEDKILEVATIVTDAELNVIATGPTLVISQPAELFDSMDDWNKLHHSKSGLWDSVQKSNLEVQAAEDIILDFLAPYTVKGKNPLCGNSIAQDRMFIFKYMKRLHEFLHYRMIDVSSFKEVVKRWCGEKALSPAKQNKHRALDDIMESIEELKFYKKQYFSSKEP
jgi:oligoribonuclease